MEVWKNLFSPLTARGLSEYEAKVYVTLIMTGASKARKLSMISGVPRTKIYGILKKLVEAGLVIEVPENPSEYAPVPPLKAFQLLLQSEEEKSLSLIRVICSMQDAYDRARAVRPEMGEVWVIRGRERILRKASEVAYDAEKFVNIMASESCLLSFYKKCNKILDELNVKGVRVQVMTPVSPRNQSFISELRYICKVKQAHVSVPLLLVYADDGQLLLAELPPDDSTESERCIGIYSRHPEVCNIIFPLLSGLLEGKPEMLKSYHPPST